MHYYSSVALIFGSYARSDAFAKPQDALDHRHISKAIQTTWLFCQWCNLMIVYDIVVAVIFSAAW